MIVKSIKKVKGIYEVDYESTSVKYHEEVILKYNLIKDNIEISNEVFNNTLLDNRYFFARDKAVNYLKNIKFKYQVIQYLKKIEDEEIINKVINNLESLKIIDDYKTCICYAMSKYQKGYGNKFVAKKLREMKVDNEIITKVIEEQTEFEFQCLKKYTEKLLKTLKPINKKDLKSKLESRLNSHGYSYEYINLVIQDISELIETYKFDQDNLTMYFEKGLKKYGYYYVDKNQEVKLVNFLLRKGFSINEIIEKVDMWKG